MEQQRRRDGLQQPGGVSRVMTGLSPVARTILAPTGILLAGLGLSVFILLSTFDMNGSHGFPLDDSWIHLQFARNLHDVGSFSYFRDEMPTSGSTSPLFTILLALGFFFTTDGMIVSYVLGIFFLILSSFLVFRLAVREFGGRLLLASGAALLVMTEPRLIWAALSGMETTLFVALLLFVVLFYRLRRPLLLGVCAGLSVWARPEGLLLIVLLLADILYDALGRRRQLTKGRKKEGSRVALSWLRPALAGIVPLLGAYAAFNMELSGSIFPNTYAAKIRYYAGGPEDFPREVLHFLTGGHMAFIAPFIAVGGLAVVVSLLRRRPEPFLLYLLWPLAMFLAYWKNLPVLYQEGRYLMPVLPFVILLGIYGLDVLLNLPAPRVSLLRRSNVRPLLVATLVGVLAVQFATAAFRIREEYAVSCKYITDRQVKTAYWLRDHLPDSAVVGTHDIGAIAFYSGKRVADMVGLVSPDMIKNIGSFGKLNNFLASRHVTHLAVLRNWFEIDNLRLLFQTDERFPEIMEVLEFDPSRVHYVPQDVTRIVDAAAFALAAGRVEQAAGLIFQALRLDPQSSRAHLVLAWVHRRRGDLDAAAAEVRAASALRPGYRDAGLELAGIAMQRGDADEAVRLLEALIREHPHYPPAYKLLAELSGSVRKDSVRAERYMHEYDELLRRGYR